MDKEISRSMVSDLILLANVDMKVTGAEYDFIIQLANRLGLVKSEVDELFKNPCPSKTLTSELERISHFYKLVLLMNIDLETHEEEVSLIRNFGLKMGIRQGVIDQILLRQNDYENKIIPTDELIKIFQTYYN